MTKNLSRSIIQRLFDFSNSSHGISRVHALPLLFLFLAFPHTRAQPGSSTPDNPYGFQGNGVNPSMTVVIIILVCAFFFIGFFAVYLRHCTESRSSVAGVGIGRSVGGGLDPELIETFPIIIYSAVKNLKIGQVPLECAVCLNEFEDDESLRLLPKCDHVFHPECIDAWLVSHITCPVCRTTLTPVDGENEIVRNYESVLDSNESPSEQNPKSELSEERNHVSINITGDQTDEPRTNEISNTTNLTNLIQNRPPRSRSTTSGRFTGKFPRSHSTGHSLVQPGENLDRYTLRLPEEVRKQIAMTSRLNRTKSHGVVLAREGSSRKGNNRTGVEATSTSSKGSNLDRGFGRFDRLSKSDRWTLTIAPPFLTRVGSVKSPKKGGNGGDVTAAEGGTAKTILTSVMGPLDCLAPKVDGAEVSTVRSQAAKDHS